MFLLAILFVLPALSLGQINYQQSAQNLFQVIDTNGNHQITPIEIHAYFSSFDSNHNGEISRQEFVSHIQGSTFRGHENELYNALDVNNDHHLSVDDFDQILAETDTNNDGHASQQEFVTYFTVLLRSAIS